MEQLKEKSNKRIKVMVFRSNRQIYASVINDGKVLATASSMEIKEAAKPIEIAEKVGENLAKKALDKKINQIFFDRNGYRYHGRVKALAEGMRKGGLNF